MITIKWAQLANPRGEVKQGFWVMEDGKPIHENAVFETRQEAEEWTKQFNWF